MNFCKTFITFGDYQRFMVFQVLQLSLLSVIINKLQNIKLSTFSSKLLTFLRFPQNSTFYLELI